MFLAVLLALPGAAALGQTSRATLVKQSDIIFIGTVTQVGAVAVPEVPASDRTVVVHVDQVLEKPAAVALGAGDSVTVQTAQPGSLKPGSQATFYTTGWIYGQGVAVREVGHEPGHSPVVVADQQAAVARARLEMNDADLKAHIQKAAMVVAGRVEQVRPAELAGGGAGASHTYQRARPPVAGSDHPGPGRHQGRAGRGTGRGALPHLPRRRVGRHPEVHRGAGRHVRAP